MRMDIWTISFFAAIESRNARGDTVSFLVCSIGSPEPPSQQKDSRLFYCTYFNQQFITTTFKNTDGPMVNNRQQFT